MKYQLQMRGCVPLGGLEAARVGLISLRSNTGWELPVSKSSWTKNKNENQLENQKRYVFYIISSQHYPSALVRDLHKL